MLKCKSSYAVTFTIEANSNLMAAKSVRIIFYYLCINIQIYLKVEYEVLLSFVELAIVKKI